MSKISSNRFVNLIGYNKITNKIENIDNVVCWRKAASEDFTKVIMKRYKIAIGMVSAHNIYRKPNTKFCKAWCHCFRDPQKYFPNKPTILLSESDFIDESSIIVLPRQKIPVYDFFYFTIGGENGVTYKGFHTFIESLPILCGEFNLKGIVIKYAANKFPFVLDGNQKRIWKKYKKNIKIISKKIDQSKIANIMANSKFGFFPNITDCSPLLLSESIVRDCPVLINENILGGWKYAKSGIGEDFNNNNLSEKINIMLNSSFSPLLEYNKQYGYKNTSMRLADFLGNHISVFENYSMIGFKNTEEIMLKGSKTIDKIIK